MLGQMMSRPLLISMIAQHALQWHANREIVSVTADQPRHRYTYREAFARAKKLSNALNKAGMRRGDRIATLAWNDYRHFEIYYGVSCAGFGPMSPASCPRRSASRWKVLTVIRSS